LTLVIAGCGRAAAPTASYDNAPGEAEEAVVMEREFAVDEGAQHAPVAPSSGVANYSSVERLIIRNASLSLVVPDTEAALDEINDLVKGLGGYVVESNVYQYQEGMQASVTLRVPAESLDTALDRIRDLATEVRRESTSGQDVTEEFVDLQSRLRYLEATESRLLEFLEQAEDTEAALAVYEQLQTIQADIEYVKGRIQYLEQSAAMATVELDITPDELAQPIEVGGWHPEGTLRDSLQSLIRALQFLVDAVIVIVVLIVPLLIAIAIPFAGLFFLVRAVVRWRRARKVKQA
jgi:DNA repair exonuclease SbcCD ATPase subunit